MLKTREFVTKNNLKNSLYGVLKRKYARLLNMESAIVDLDVSDAEYESKNSEMETLDAELLDQINEAFTKGRLDSYQRETTKNKELDFSNEPEKTPKPAPASESSAPSPKPEEKSNIATEEKSSGMGALIGLAALALAGGIGYYFFNKRK
jgi:hypothetical protein